MKYSINYSILVIFLFLTSFNCSSNKSANIPNIPKTENVRPEWVDKGGGFYKGEKGTAFYGIGAASNINNISLRRNAADAQARADLARVFNSKVQDLMKIYARSVTNGDIKNVSEEQFTQQTIKTFTELNLSGTLIVDRYYSPGDKTQYSLVMLDVPTFKKQLDTIKDLAPEIKAGIIENAENAFKELNDLSSK